MTIASDAVVEACWPEDIPRDYNELHRDFGNFIAAAIRKHNKVGRNYEELHAHVWKRLVEKDVIQLFMNSVAEKLPRQLTAIQACAYLGITFKQWKTKMGSYHIGIPIRSKHDPKVIIGRKQRGWMPTPINAAEFEAECHKHNAALVARGKDARPVTNGSQRRDAIYDIDDIITLSTMEVLLPNGTVRGPFVKQGPMQHPEIKATKAHFQAYLAKSIFSDFANWCRTYKRKWSQDRPMFHREGDDNNDADWEQKLVDPGGASQETRAVLKEAVIRISQTLHENMKGADTLQCKPVEQLEMQMYELLEQSVPLPEVMRKLQVPERVRRAVLKSVADFRSRAA